MNIHKYKYIKYKSKYLLECDKQKKMQVNSTMYGGNNRSVQHNISSDINTIDLYHGIVDMSYPPYTKAIDKLYSIFALGFFSPDGKIFDSNDKNYFPILHGIVLPFEWRNTSTRMTKYMNYFYMFREDYDLVYYNLFIKFSLPIVFLREHMKEYNVLSPSQQQ